MGHPNFLAAASQILDSPKLRIFSSRLLCKLPGTEEDPNSREVPWHQDSQYWPLEPMKEATLWLALDDVTEENGAMDMFTFSAVPEKLVLNLTDCNTLVARAKSAKNTFARGSLHRILHQDGSRCLGSPTHRESFQDDTETGAGGVP